MAEPNVLADIVERDERTHDEIVAAFNELSPKMGESATISVRTFRRWLAGDVATKPRPSQSRVAGRYWGKPIAELLAPVGSNVAASPGREPAEVPSPEGGGDDIERRISAMVNRSIRFARFAQSGSLGNEALAQLRDEVSFTARRFLNDPVLEMLGGLAELQDGVFGLLERGRHSVDVSRDLYVSGAVVTGLLAHAMKDMGRSQEAVAFARTVYVCGEAAGDNLLQAWARGELSLIAYRDGRFQAALDFANRAIELTDGVRGSTRPWVFALKARALAKLGDGIEARRAIDDSRRARDSLVRDSLDRFGGLYEFGEAKHRYYVAGALADIAGGGADAEREALLAIEFFAGHDEKFYATVAGARAELALARAHLGELEGARDALQPVFALPTSRRVTGIIDSVMRVYARLEQPDAISSPISIDLREEIEEFRRFSASTMIR